MSKGGDRLRALCAGLFVASVMACGSGSASAADKGKPQPAGTLSAAQIAHGSVETVRFDDPRHAPVRLLRGTAPPADRPVRRETISFGDGTAARVTIVRGAIEPEARHAALEPQKRIEKLNFGDPSRPGVTVVRGGAGLRELFTVDLFSPANAGELDRIAFAVDGAESSHGVDSRMWRPDPNGPQGPMQVSAAAALDVGGGNRFSLVENRLLGRSYLARMFRRYGNWPDALAAYNWGPGNVDQWIASGRSRARLPPETSRYIDRVLRDALITAVAARL
jgi:Transglycosylase SLT domain